MDYKRSTYMHRPDGSRRCLGYCRSAKEMSDTDTVALSWVLTLELTSSVPNSLSANRLYTRDQDDESAVGP